MRRLAPWAWLIVLGTALALSWWSLDALGLHFGMPEMLAATVSATFDDAALVAAGLAMRRAAVADSAASVKLLMVVAVGLSAWRGSSAATAPAGSASGSRWPSTSRWRRSGSSPTAGSSRSCCPSLTTAPERDRNRRCHRLTGIPASLLSQRSHALDSRGQPDMITQAAHEVTAVDGT
jgi:hypothetical protein